MSAKFTRRGFLGGLLALPLLARAAFSATQSPEVREETWEDLADELVGLNFKTDRASLRRANELFARMRTPDLSKICGRLCDAAPKPVRGSLRDWNVALIRKCPEYQRACNRYGNWREHHKR